MIFLERNNYFFRHDRSNSGKIIKINNLDKKQIIIMYFLPKLLILFMSEEIKTIIIIIFRRMLTIF